MKISVNFSHVSVDMCNSCFGIFVIGWNVPVSSSVSSKVIWISCPVVEFCPPCCSRILMWAIPWVL